jgi:hypothetical protein
MAAPALLPSFLQQSGVSGKQSRVSVTSTFCLFFPIPGWWYWWRMQDQGGREKKDMHR